jgi:hypothetical protein
MTVPTEQTLGWLWPTRANVTSGAERYFQFLQRQVDLNQQIANSWVAAVAPTSRAVHSQTRGTRHPPAVHRDPVAEHADAGDDMSSHLAEHEPTEPSTGQNLERNDLFDSVIDGLIDADILATR